MASPRFVAARLPLHLQSSVRGCASAASSALSSAPQSSAFSHRRTRVPSEGAAAPRFHFRGARTTFTVASHGGGLAEVRHPFQLQHQQSQPPPPSAEFHTSQQAPFQTRSSADEVDGAGQRAGPGSIAFGECEIAALSDLFLQFAKDCDGEGSGGSTNGAPGPYLTLERIRLLLESVGEKPTDETLRSLMEEINSHGDGKLRLECFLRASDRILGKAPARIVLVVGGPGSGKGALCERLARDCGAVHLSCGEMLREEVEAGTPLGKEVAGIMERGDLVSSAVVTALMRRRMRRHPGRRILLDGFPRSLENARDFVDLCGPPELALHLDCDDTILIERILARGGRSAKEAERAEREGRPVAGGAGRSDDNVHTALNRLKNYHRHHQPTMSWLKEMRVPVVELDCSGSKDDVWGQLVAIGRLMRPAVKLPREVSDAVAVGQQATLQERLGRERQQQQRSELPGQELGLNGAVDEDDGASSVANEDLRWIA